MNHADNLKSIFNMMKFAAPATSARFNAMMALAMGALDQDNLMDAIYYAGMATDALGFHDRDNMRLAMHKATKK